MFNFDFDIDEDPSAEFSSFAETPAFSQRDTDCDFADKERLCTEIPLSDLLSALPPAISFAPLPIPLSSERKVTLARRDLFDARFQVISQAESEDAAEPKRDDKSELDFLDAPSDLVPGVYEGGLKTWECCLDLVDYLDNIYAGETAARLKGKRALELGCGTAIPTMYLLHELFSAESSPETPSVELHLQDYNDLVLRLVTLPNIILTWYMSPASASFRAVPPPSSAAEVNAHDTDADPLPAIDLAEPGELPLTPALTAAFLASLAHHHIALRFFAGGWASFDPARTGGRYDVVLTAETIYRTASLPALVGLLRRACAHGGDDLAARAEAQLAIGARARAPLCLVAAKRVYFGVGGGVAEFVRAAAERGRGAVDTVWEHAGGVQRCIMRVVWAAG